MERTQIWHALQGVRGGPPADPRWPGGAACPVQPVARRFFPRSRRSTSTRWLASSERIIALDGRILLAAPESPPHPSRHFTPIPTSTLSPSPLRDGHRGDRSAHFAPRTKPADHWPCTPAIPKHTIRMRFFSMVKTLSAG